MLFPANFDINISPPPIKKHKPLNLFLAEKVNTLPNMRKKSQILPKIIDCCHIHYNFSCKKEEGEGVGGGREGKREGEGGKGRRITIIVKK